MRLTPEITIWIEELVIQYSVQLSIRKPRCLLKVSDVLALPLEITRGRRTSAYRYQGVTYLKHRIVFINVRRSRTLNELKQTVAHELVHLRFPYLSHGDGFRKKVEAVMLGRSFRAYRRRIP